jgi:hypothetical protein
VTFFPLNSLPREASKSPVSHADEYSDARRLSGDAAAATRNRSSAAAAKQPKTSRATSASAAAKTTADAANVVSMLTPSSASGSRLSAPAFGEPEIHRVDPEFGSTQEVLIGISSQTAGSTCEFWVNPVNFTLGARLDTEAQSA